MLNAEDNRLLTDISPGSPMGNLMRQYWMPVMLSEELPEADGNPVRLTVLCENLVIFRDTGGRVGLFSEYCPHRRASLYYGRNEEGGLRCLYHGWKFDVTGQCLDMPNEPPESNFKNKLRQVAYPCREAGRHDLGLHGTAGDDAAAARVRMDEHAGGAAADIAVPARVQLDAGARGRHRHDALRVPPQPARTRRVRREHLAPGTPAPHGGGPDAGRGDVRRALRRD